MDFLRQATQIVTNATNIVTTATQSVSNDVKSKAKRNSDALSTESNSKRYSNSSSGKNRISSADEHMELKEATEDVLTWKQLYLETSTLLSQEQGKYDQEVLLSNWNQGLYFEQIQKLREELEGANLKYLRTQSKLSNLINEHESNLGMLFKPYQKNLRNLMRNPKTKQLVWDYVRKS